MADRKPTYRRAGNPVLHRAWRVGAVICTLLSFPVSAWSQLNRNDQSEVIEAVLQRLDSAYVFPDLAEAMAAHVRGLAQADAYDEMRDPATFAQRLTADLRSVSEDLHLAVYVRRPRRQAEPPAAPRTMANDDLVRGEILDGNIGYLRVTRFDGPARLAEPLETAMRRVAGTDALVIDLRDNGGGSPASVMLLAGYLIPERTLVARIYSRPDDRYREMWTTPVDGPHYAGAVFILTNRNTFSAAEAAAYHLKHLGVARTVGQPSGGGAHRISRAPLPHGLEMTLPYTRPINVVTATDWERTGVVPDIAVPAEEALVAAQLAALRALPSTPERDAAIRRLSG